MFLPHNHTLHFLHHIFPLLDFIILTLDDSIHLGLRPVRRKGQYHIPQLKVKVCNFLQTSHALSNNSLLIIRRTVLLRPIFKP